MFAAALGEVSVDRDFQRFLRMVLASVVTKPSRLGIYLRGQINIHVTVRSPC